MEGLKLLGVSLIITSLLMITSVQAFGFPYVEGDKYENLGIRHEVRPNVCLFEPDLEQVDLWYWKTVEYESLKAILEWQISLQEFFPDGDWTMYVHSTVPYEEHWNKTPDDYRHCNILLTFEPWNTDHDSNALGFTGIDFSHSKHKYTYIVIYLHGDVRNGLVIDLNDMKKNDDGVYEFTIEKKPLPPHSIYNIVLHEMGHGLGLGHYKGSDLQDYEKSALVPMLKPFGEEIRFKITLEDKFQLAQIYGIDGYQKPNPWWIPDHCLFKYGKSIACY